MTPEDVARRVKAIAECRGDDEAAHGMEDRLHWDVLQAIAAGHATDPAGCAAEALKSSQIDFARWCA